MERALEAATGLLGSVPVSDVSTLWNPDTCPTELLPWLAWAESVDEWSSLWSVPMQRAVIKAHRQVRRVRGTRAAVEAAIQAFGGIVSIREWWEYSPQKTPHTFDVVITGGSGYVEAELQDSMIRAINRAKPVRSHYVLGVGLTAGCQLGFVGIARVATFKRMTFQG
jgi:phage tail P2-like protein